LAGLVSHRMLDRASAWRWRLDSLNWFTIGRIEHRTYKAWVTPSAQQEQHHGVAWVRFGYKRAGPCMQ